MPLFPTSEEQAYAGGPYIYGEATALKASRSFMPSGVPQPVTALQPGTCGISFDTVNSVVSFGNSAQSVGRSNLGIEDWIDKAQIAAQALMEESAQACPQRC